MGRFVKADREFPGFECDHLRPKVRMGAKWYHITPEGDVGGECTAGTYRVTALYRGEHYVSELVRPLPDEPLTESEAKKVLIPPLYGVWWCWDRLRRLFGGPAPMTGGEA